MKISKGKLITSFFMVIFLASLCSFAYAQDTWNVPEKYKSMKNPVKSDDVSKATGKALFLKNCASCHGKTGLGDGSKAKTLTETVGDMTASKFQTQTDGEHFYKTKFGKGEMPKYDKKIPDEDIWTLVNFMRSLKK